MFKNFSTMSPNELLEVLRASTSDDYLLEAAYQLSLHPDPRATQILLSRLEREHEPWIRERLVSALGVLQDPETANVFLAIFTSPSEDESVKCQAALGLGDLNYIEAVEPLIKTLETGNLRLAFPCVAALGHIRDPRAIESLIKALEFNDILFPHSAAEALGNYGAEAERALPTLRRIAASVSEPAKRKVLRAIEKIETNNPMFDNPFGAQFS